MGFLVFYGLHPNESSGFCIADNFCADDPCNINFENQATCNHTPNGPECVCNTGYAMNVDGMGEFRFK